MALDELKTRSVVFVNARQEAGINEIYDPDAGSFMFQVFIHNQFPYTEEGAWLFPTFAEARSFAAQTFQGEWEMLLWDKDIKRPCSEGGGGCGSGGSCGTGGGCGSSGGGCGSSGGGCGSEGGGCGSA